MYKIKITYTGGDSFKTEHGKEDFIEHEWKDLDVAAENLNRIKEHYEYYSAVNTNFRYLGSENKKKIQEIIENAPTQRWYAGDARDCDYSVYFVTDENRGFKYGTYQWCGYFERLEGAEVVEVVPELPKFTI